MLPFDDYLNQGQPWEPEMQDYQLISDTKLAPGK